MTAHKMTKKEIARVVKIAILVGMICFFFPFVLVSCEGEEIARSSGVEMMIKTSFSDDYDFDEDDQPNWILWGAFGLGIAGLVLAIRAGEEASYNLIPAGEATAGGAALLLIFSMTFRRYYGLDDYGDSISVSYEWGWALALISYIVASITALFSNFLVLGLKEDSAGRRLLREEGSYTRYGGTESKGDILYAAESGLRSVGDKLKQTFDSRIGGSVTVCVCGAKLLPDAKFCAACGREVAEVKKDVCSCGAKLVPGAKFCVACGREITEAEENDYVARASYPPSSRIRVSSTVGSGNGGTAPSSAFKRPTSIGGPSLDRRAKAEDAAAARIVRAETVEDEELDAICPKEESQSEPIAEAESWKEEIKSENEKEEVTI